MMREKPTPPPTQVVCRGCGRSWDADTPARCECVPAWVPAVAFAVVVLVVLVVGLCR